MRSPFFAFGFQAIGGERCRVVVAGGAIAGTVIAGLRDCSVCGRAERGIV
ncbi:hypothetical protein [Cupriavidus basilensis]|nr:hypothetical protein [Cupriavidus basilensis]